MIMNLYIRIFFFVIHAGRHKRRSPATGLFLVITILIWAPLGSRPMASSSALGTEYVAKRNMFGANIPYIPGS